MGSRDLDKIRSISNKHFVNCKDAHPKVPYNEKQKNQEAEHDCQINMKNELFSAPKEKMYWDLHGNSASILNQP